MDIISQKKVDTYEYKLYSKKWFLIYIYLNNILDFLCVYIEKMYIAGGCKGCSVGGITLLNKILYDNTVIDTEIPKYTCLLGEIGERGGGELLILN